MVRCLRHRCVTAVAEGCYSSDQRRHQAPVELADELTRVRHGWLTQTAGTTSNFYWRMERKQKDHFKIDIAELFFVANVIGEKNILVFFWVFSRA